MKTLSQIKAVISQNRTDKNAIYAGLTSSEIGQYNRSLMFGQDNAGFQNEEEWAAIVD